jgi:diaminopimelate epimerase
MQNIIFYKMHGSGNDFILIDNRKLQLPIERMKTFSQKTCQQAFGVGANGMIFIDHPSHLDHIAYRWHFYNADGSRGEMCGNGGRCVAWLTVHLGIAKIQHQFQTDVGIVKAIVYPEKKKVKLLVMPPKDLKIDLTHYKTYPLHFINVGVPHTVILVDDIQSTQVKEIGLAIRFHPIFVSKGTNVNFVQVLDRKHLSIRTYERGVENETFSCGTGSIAAAIITNRLGLTENTVELTTSGQETLKISLEQDQVWLEGPVQLVYIGQLNPEIV